MSDFIPKFLDPYDRPARLYPGLLVFAPLAVLLVSFYGMAQIIASSIVSILGFCGVAYALGRVARDAGKRIQDKLFAKWGGAPTIQMLRHRDTLIDIHTKERFHEVLSQGIGKTMPSTETELADPVAADELYRAATVWLISQTRNAKEFPLVFKENVAFGFHRNALGMRSIGVSVSVICLVWLLLHIKVLEFSTPFFAPEKIGDMSPSDLVSLVISALMLTAWLLLFNESSVKRAGFSYAERLLQSCDRIKPKSRVIKKSTTLNASGD